MASRAQTSQPKGTLFENVRIFDGKSDKLSSPSNVLVLGNVIKSISTAAITPPPDVALTRVQGNGQTLTPGLIDAHTHIMFATVPQLAVLTTDITFVTVAAVKEARDSLLRGFTSIRDMGGPSFGLKRGIDAGLAPGPRIWSSPRPAVTATSGYRTIFPPGPVISATAKELAVRQSRTTQRPCASGRGSCWRSAPRKSS